MMLLEYLEQVMGDCSGAFDGDAVKEGWHLSFWIRVDVCTCTYSIVGYALDWNIR